MIILVSFTCYKHKDYPHFPFYIGGGLVYYALDVDSGEYIHTEDRNVYRS